MNANDKKQVPWRHSYRRKLPLVDTICTKYIPNECRLNQFDLESSVNNELQWEEVDPDCRLQLEGLLAFVR
jgi:hypothetical protein